MTDLLSLADEIEALQGPSREMDERIAINLGLLSEADSVFDEGGNYLNRSSPYTHSVDAALSLVPDGLYPAVDYPYTYDYPIYRCTPTTVGSNHCEYSKLRGEAKTLPLSISAASLRALAHNRGDL